MENTLRRKELLSKLTIGIAAYNGWDGLKKTLEKLVSMRLQDAQVIIFDDGSPTKIDFELQLFPLSIYFKRFEKSLGCVKQRNNIAEATKTKYLLSIDDDSYPVRGDISEVIEEMEKRDDVAVMALDVCGPNDPVRHNPKIEKPTDIRYFVLCAALIRIDHFKAIDGLQNPDELGWIYNEELDYSLRCWRDGKRIMLDRRLLVLHDRELLDGQDSYKSACYAKGLGYIHGRYYRGIFSLFKLIKMPFMIFNSPRTKKTWAKSIFSYIKCLKVGISHRNFDKSEFKSKTQWHWDSLDNPPYA